ncbi:hypothetical protein [Variovorax sp. AFSI2.2]|uniref:hypothetical protein n=1 Tax=Variovorax sp. AFSI2.2 TaxID=3384160 RepID=UPI003EBA9D27
MYALKQKMLAALAAALGLAIATILYVAYTFPSEVTCLFIKSMALEPLADGTLVEPGSSELERAIFLDLQSQARVRIEKTFGTPRSRPVVAFFRDSQTFWPLKVNNYGSAGSIGNACVIIGPKGQTVDVVAHELMHQELRERVGSWGLFAEIPIWFNEGVAMQVDFRPQYTLPKEARIRQEIAAVRGLKSVSQFNHGSDEQLTQHYAFAKAEVEQWLGNVGHHDLYPRLERVRAGDSFDAVLVK